GPPGRPPNREDRGGAGQAREFRAGLNRPQLRFRNLYLRRVAGGTLLAEGHKVLVDSFELHERARKGSSEVLVVDADEMQLEPDELRRLCSRHQDVRVIIVARSVPAERAVAFMRAGARDVLSADWFDCLPAVLERELGESERHDQMHRSGRVRAERAIARRERRFRRLVENTADGFYVFDAQGNVLDANERGA